MSELRAACCHVQRQGWWNEDQASTHRTRELDHNLSLSPAHVGMFPGRR